MTGEASPVQQAGFLVALRAKGESVDEVRGLADVMLAHARPISVAEPSWTSWAPAATGPTRSTSPRWPRSSSPPAGSVVKHGNRAASSSSGSADVLEALGVNLTLSPAQVARVAELAGITFCFAQAFHPSMRHAAEARRDLGIATAFNVLGPSPTRHSRRMPPWASPMPAWPRSWPACSPPGKDAAVFRVTTGSTSSPSARRRRSGGSGTAGARAPARPRDVGLELHPLETLRGADAAHNAGVARQVFEGQRSPVRDAVVVNAGIALALTEPDAEATRRTSSPACAAAWTGPSRRWTRARPCAGSRRPGQPARRPLTPDLSAR